LGLRESLTLNKVNLFDMRSLSTFLLISSCFVYDVVRHARKLTHSFHDKDRFISKEKRGNENIISKFGYRHGCVSYDNEIMSSIYSTEEYTPITICIFVEIAGFYYAMKVLVNSYNDRAFQRRNI